MSYHLHFLLLFIPSISSHISLTFPQSRYPPLDFLDSFRTKGPCGVPYPKKKLYTNLLTNSSYNITWRMAYPHQGGYRLRLIDSKGDTINELNPMNEYSGIMDQTEMSESVEFSTECLNCTIVLERQAIEWGNSYTFHSCADVNIYNEENEDTQCNGKGVIKDDKCDCDPGYGGDQCTIIVHCQLDEDCGKGGKCIEEKGSIIRRSCYCPYGLYGRNCESQFNGLPDNCFAYDSIREGDFNRYGMFNEECYMRKSINNNDTVYYRHLKSEDEIEIIVDFLTTSWIGIGWRPDGLDPSCRLFPDLEGARYKRQTDTSSTVMIPPLIESFPSSTTRDSSVPTRITQDGPIPVMPKNNGLLSSALHAPLHAMDCIDMIIGSVIDGRSRLQDLYSRDRSTPLEDHWYDGMDSLNAAYGIELDGRTILMFRRSRQEIEPTDHPLGGTNQFIVWAKGQTKGSYSHGIPSGLDKGPHSISSSSFYSDDVVNYHGDKNRGVFRIDFTSPLSNNHNIQDRLRDSSSSSHLPPIIIDPITSHPSTIQSNQISSELMNVIDDSTISYQSSISSSLSLSFLIFPLILLLR